MTVALERTVLVWDPGDPVEFGIDVEEFRALGMETLCVPYSRLGKDPDLLRRIKSTGAEAIVFTRNDDMEGDPPIGPVLSEARMGYTTLSAIDPEFQKEQTRACVADFVAQHGEVELPDVTDQRAAESRGHTDGTCTVVFDMEQLGGVRFGLPRLLKHLESVGIRATFFVTGFIAALYPEVLTRLRAAGHEIAIHGSMHEFLSGRSYEEQVQRLSDHINCMKHFSKISGANFIYRMDGTTVEALVAAGIQYFVLLRQHRLYRSRILAPSCTPRCVRTSMGDITLFPIPVETYPGDLGHIVDSMKSAWKTSVKDGTRHISVLMHPFKDGSLRRMDLTRSVIHYLTDVLHLRSVTLNSLPILRSPDRAAARIHYRWEGFPPACTQGDSVPNVTRSWWNPVEYHALRAECLMDTLNTIDCPTVFGVEESFVEPGVSIFPDLIGHEGVTIRDDPVTNPRSAAGRVMRALTQCSSVNVCPPRFVFDVLNYVLFHIPRTWRETVLTLEKIKMRLRRLLRPGKG